MEASKDDVVSDTTITGDLSDIFEVTSEFLFFVKNRHKMADNINGSICNTSPVLSI